MKNLLLTFTALLLSLPVAGSATEDDLGTWMTLSTSDAFQTGGQDSRWQYTFDAQARYFDLGSGINQWLVRPGIGYEFGNNAKAWVGYARFRTRNAVGDVANENRYWQQVDWSGGDRIGGRVSMRVRLEQRYVSVGDDAGLVLRFMAKYTRPIGDTGSTNLIIGVEPFFDLKDTDWGGESGFGQNRVFVGVGKRFSDRISVEAGYMNQFLLRDNAENRRNHFAVLNFKVKL